MKNLNYCNTSSDESHEEQGDEVLQVLPEN
jgi:hypothetical protein